jgi:hypothetical protein
MTLPSLVEIEARVRELAARIGATGDKLPTFGRSEDGARPHVEVNTSGLHFVVVERGEELERFTTNDLDELLWRVFESITFSLASDYEGRHRVRGQDFRRVMFAKQVELLATLSPAWAAREARNHDQILERHPFEDV